MKKLVILFAAATFIVSCGNNNSDAGTNTTSETNAGTETPAAGESTDPGNAPTAGAAASADADKGLDLIAKSDCLTCHKVEEKVVGPAYREVANKYAGKPGAVDSLASKIIHGGAGNWGQVPMTPHPQISKEDAETMVKYILSLKS